MRWEGHQLLGSEQVRLTQPSCSRNRADLGDNLLWAKKVLTDWGCRGADWHASSRLEVVKTHTMEFEMESASLHPGGDKFVAGGEDMWVRLYDFQTGGELGAHPRAPS